MSETSGPDREMAPLAKDEGEAGSGGQGGGGWSGNSLVREVIAAQLSLERACAEKLRGLHTGGACGFPRLDVLSPRWENSTPGVKKMR